MPIDIVESLRRAGPFAPVLGGVDLSNIVVFDLSVGSLLLGADPKAMETTALTEMLFGQMRAARAPVGIGRYNEARLLYRGTRYGSGHATEERRTIHLGLDLFAEPGTPVCAPLAGVVHAFANNREQYDYGPVIILRHENFFTLYGHLEEDSLAGLRVGQPVERGERFAAIGSPPANGDWTPHLHFQIVTDPLDLGCNYPGVALPSRRAEFLNRSPDPNLILGLPLERTPEPAPNEIVRGWRQYLYDNTGQAFLDLNAETALVGHSHPRVVEAVSRQLALLNTGSSLSHKYAERLLSKFPAPLSKCYLVNSASEAMELAVRLARAHVRGKDAIVLKGSDHGITTTLINMSPLRFDGPGGAGRKHWVHVASRSDAREVTEIVDSIESSGRGLAAFVSDGLLPPGYLAQAYPCVRDAGGVCIASEVRTGFGRIGESFWGFALHNVVPDIVVLGESMGNGFPLAGVVTTPEIAASFDNGMELHSPTGGNPVACAAGLAVLDILEEEKLPASAQRIGAKLLREITGIRGAGLCLELQMKNNRLRERGILAAIRGDVLQIQPPLVFTEEDAICLVDVLRTG